MGSSGSLHRLVSGAHAAVPRRNVIECIYIGPATLAGGGAGFGLAVGGDGSAYMADFSDGNWSFLRRISPSGIVSTFAGVAGAPFGYGVGRGIPYGVGQDGLLATNVGAVPRSIAVGADGTVFFVEVGNSIKNGAQGYIRAIRPDGTITTLYGSGGAASGALQPFANNGPAAAQDFQVGTVNLAVAADGSLLVSYGQTATLLRIHSPVEPSADGFSVADADGRSLFLFDGDGRHLQTVDTLTSAVVYSFSYDETGRLSSFTDVNGDATTIVRDVHGNPTAIVNPFGQATSLTVDSNGLLKLIQDSAGDAYRYSYDGHGLLQSTTAPTGGQYQYTLDGEGRLLVDVDPSGGGATYSNVLTATGNIVTRTTSMGVTSTFELDQLASGVENQIQTDSAGLKTTTVRGNDGTVISTERDGTVISLSTAPDPRFGMQAPIVATSTISTPAGVTSTSSNTRAVTLGDPSNPLTLQTETRQTTLNGNTWTGLFNVSTSSWTTTSPAGRVSTTTVDAADRPTQISMANVAPLAFVYDSHGRLSSASQASRVWTQGYEAKGTSHRDRPAGRHRLVHERPRGPTHADDARRRPSPRRELRRRQQHHEHHAAEHRAARLHVHAGRPARLVQPAELSSASPSTTYTYDLDRELTTMTRPDGVEVTYGYDSAGRLRPRPSRRAPLTRTYNATTGHLQSLAAPERRDDQYPTTASSRPG